jgi:hypothetical protein
LRSQESLFPKPCGWPCRTHSVSLRTAVGQWNRGILVAYEVACQGGPARSGEDEGTGRQIGNRVLATSKVKVDFRSISKPPRRIYDSRSKIDVRDHPHHSANDSIWMIFSADFFDKQRQWLHGESAATELFPRRTRPRWSHPDSFAGLPDARGRSSSTQPAALGGTNRGPAFSHSLLVGILLLGAAADWPDTFSQTVLVRTDSSCSSAADHTGYVHNRHSSRSASRDIQTHL